MTLKQLATTVRNGVVDGLKGVSSLAFSIEQLEDEILLATPALILQFEAQGLLDVSRISQRMDGIGVECQDLSANCEVPAETCAPHFEIPGLNLSMRDPVPFIGTPDAGMQLKVYLDRDYRYHKYRMHTSKMPFAWVSTTSNENGFFDVYLFNLGKYENLKFISLEAHFDNPYDLLKTEYYSQFSNAEYYAPAIIQDALIQKMTANYIRYYRQLAQPSKPNTQQ